MNKNIVNITSRITKRSSKLRQSYLARLDQAKLTKINRTALSCSNLAHGFAACGMADKQKLSGEKTINLGIITAYNDMLSAHQPYQRYPAVIKEAARTVGATAQVAGATPAMCDGVTQGQIGMELSLFSRDVIAQATAVGFSHAMYDGGLLLGICDKIVPGLMIGALSFGHLPMMFVPGGPMKSGLDNKSKALVRERFAIGKATRIELLKSESASYHSPGTCTFYGTANSNQMFMEIMGLHVPASTFINPDDPRRDLLTSLAVTKLTTVIGKDEYALGRLINEKAIVNAMAGLLATGGSTNHTIHLVAIAKVAGIIIDWQDFEDLSQNIPLLTRVYPNGQADVNHFRDAGGLAWIINELTANGLMHDDVQTMFGKGLRKNYLKDVNIEKSKLVFTKVKFNAVDESIISKVRKPFSPTGGIKLMKGNLGRSICKVSAVPKENLKVTAPSIVFDSQQELLNALKKGLDQDFVAVIRFQGVSANGMPELHKLTPGLAVLQKRGRKVALVTDGRMSGASGAVPAAIHLSPEANLQGNIAKVKTGDLIELDCIKGKLNVKLTSAELKKRKVAKLKDKSDFGCGRELFANMRKYANQPESGATIFFN